MAGFSIDNDYLSRNGNLNIRYPVEKRDPPLTLGSVPMSGNDSQKYSYQGWWLLTLWSETPLVFDSNYKSIDDIEILIKAGDKYLHQYIAEHKRSGKEILIVLLQYAKTKKLKQQILKRLEQA